MSDKNSLAAWNRLHLIGAALLALALALLPLLKIATPAGCCGAAAPAAAPAVAAVAAAPAADASATAAAPAAAPPAAKLYFDVDVSDKIAEGDAGLAPIVAWLGANPQARAVVTGYHDPTARAQTVQAALVAAGVAADRIDLVKPISTNGGGDLKEARRVEVSVK